jgi:hypothetical protein
MNRRWTKPPSHGPHMIYTEVQDFDDAIELLKRSRKRPQKVTLKTLFAQNLNRQRFRPITLSDRLVPGKIPAILKNKVPAPAQTKIVWGKNEVLANYNTGFFKLRELAHHGVSILQVRLWVYGPNWKPATGSTWSCNKCHSRILITNVNPQYICPKCGNSWDNKLTR